MDSQETTCQNGAAANAIDGNPSTIWVTQWCTTSAPLPHEIQINLGASYSLSAFQYLPRQDGCANGWIKQYAFYVNTDGVNWGTAVATGTFSYGGLSTACPGAGVPAAIQVNFAPVTGPRPLRSTCWGSNGWTRLCSSRLRSPVLKSADESFDYLGIELPARTLDDAADGHAG